MSLLEKLKQRRSFRWTAVLGFVSALPATAPRAEAQDVTGELEGWVVECEGSAYD